VVTDEHEIMPKPQVIAQIEVKDLRIETWTTSRALHKQAQNEPVPQIGRRSKNAQTFMVATALAFLATQANAQDSKSAEPSRASRSSDAKLADTSKNIVPVKVTVVFYEYDGEKKLSTLPYVSAPKSRRKLSLRGKGSDRC